MKSRRIPFLVGLLLLDNLGFGQSFGQFINNQEVGLSRMVFLDDYYYGETNLDEILFSVEYKRSMEIDTLRHRVCTFQDILLVGDHWTKYQNKIKWQYDTYSKKGITQAWGRLRRDIDQHVYWADFYDAYLTDRLQKEVLFSCRMGAEDYLVREPQPIISWLLSDSTKVIGSYTCHKAKAFLGGRNWIAWYTLEIPVPSGPWKLSGLPGLILIAYDETGQYKFAAQSVSNTSGCISKLNYPYISISREQYNRMFRQMLEDYYSFINSHLSGSGFKQIGEPGRVYEMTPMSYEMIEKR